MHSYSTCNFLQFIDQLSLQFLQHHTYTIVSDNLCNQATSFAFIPELETKYEMLTCDYGTESSFKTRVSLTVAMYLLCTLCRWKANNEPICIFKNWYKLGVAGCAQQQAPPDKRFSSEACKSQQ